MPITRDQVIQALSTVNDPELHKDLVTLQMVKDVEINGDAVKVGIELTTPGCPMKDAIGKDVEAAIKGAGATSVEIDWSAQVRATAQLQAQLPGVKNAIAVGAGKGGVGKSTISVLTALGLARDGARVGLMDADIYGPSIHKMMGLDGQRPAANGDKIVPMEAHGIAVMSMGLLLSPDDTTVWRGPMVHGVIKQFLTQVEWGELDYLIIDLPPGTGDAPLTLSQSLSLTGAVIVCTPQEVALMDAIRALRMYQKLNVNILGIVENMSYFRAPDTGNEYDLFGRGGARKEAERLDIPFLGEVPINISIRESGDEGTPVSNFEKTDETTRNAIMSFVRNLAGRISVANTEEAPVELRIT